MNGEVFIHQVPTVGTTVMLERKVYLVPRFLFLLCGIGMVEAKTAKPIGLEECNAVSEQDTNRREVSNGKDFETNHIAHVCTGLWAFGRRSSWDRQHAAVSQQQQQ